MTNAPAPHADLFSHEELTSVYETLDTVDPLLASDGTDHTASYDVIYISAHHETPQGTTALSSASALVKNGLQSEQVLSPTTEELNQASSAHSSADSTTAEVGTSASTTASSARRRELLTEEEKKANHIHSEQRRRQNIKVGLDELCTIVPNLIELKRQENEAKREKVRLSSKLALGEAKILQETFDYTQELHQDMAHLDEQIAVAQKMLEQMSA
ncbi:hypothetical protein H4R34_004802 [Dimargaris verticillata]|uniref:BHLH domain-containing protein n=1 Tax=Dimargaris verticillata TaxID=2761393 RepID=A0A9W8B1V1_9FUNG|nr:hypothetical protein H4R34_004802 [Dimargaris verticillata]